MALILVTGFAPYHGESVNASEELIRSIQKDPPKPLSTLQDRLAFAVLPCVEASRASARQALQSELTSLLSRYDPAVCLHLGQSPACRVLTLEQRARNQFMGGPIDPVGPESLWSDCPGQDRLVAALIEQGIEAAESDDAGDYLCNHALYSSLQAANRSGRPHAAVLVHIPVLPGQQRFHTRASTLPMSISRRALVVMVRHIASALDRRGA